MRSIHGYMQSYSRRVKKEDAPSQRELTLDILRGVAVILMIVAHAVVFFHDRSNSFLNFLTSSGDTLAFTTFLFVSGAVGYLTVSNKKKAVFEQREKQLRRVFNFLFGYYLLAFVITFPSIDKSLSPHLIRDIYEIIFFVNVPIYTEFMIPFIFFGFLQAFIPRQLGIVGSKIWAVILISIISYISAYFLYQTFIPQPLVYIKAIFVGHPELIRFPILFYLPIYLLGLFWGRIIHSKNDIEEKRSVSSFFAIAFTVVLIYIAIVSPVAQLGYFEDTWERWPPSIGFLTRGLTFVFYFLFIFSLRKSQGVKNVILRGVEFFGKLAFLFYVAHILILTGYRYLFDTVYANPLVVSALILALFLLTILLNVIFLYSFKLINTLFGKGEKRNFFEILWAPFVRPNDTRLIKKRYFIVAAILLLALSTNVGVEDDVIIPTITAQDIAWWNYDYNSFKQITVKNNNAFTSINSGDAVFFRVDHKGLVDTQKSKVGGEDLRMVHLNAETNEYVEVPIILKSPNTESTEVLFRIQSNIWAQQFDPNYFLYYGNNFERNLLAEDTPEEQLIKPKSFQIIIGSEELPDLSISTSKQWVLRDATSDENSNLIITATANTDDLGKSSIIEYQVEDTSFQGTMDYLVSGISTRNEQWNTSFDVRSLPVGEYRVAVVAKDLGGNIVYESPKRGFYVSEPMYVAWTMDWEGYNVEDRYLTAMDSLSSKHNNLPITHFFNPRIYYTADTGQSLAPVLSATDVVSSSQADKLTSWVIDRRDNNGDQIALHLHMQYDFVEAAGVTPRTGPKWSGFDNGYDVATTAYSQEELQKIVGLALDYYESNGLQKPTVYRAGGWQVDHELFQTLENFSFKADSSGRESTYIGGLPVPWTLTRTQDPYQISRIDYNTTSPIPGDNYNLWELPNNGGNSGTYDANALISAFNENFESGVPLKKKKLVVSLSHPHWFDSQEELRIDDYLSYSDQFLNSEDKGPVIYVTLDEAMQAFDIL